jgi:predicted permease
VYRALLYLLPPTVRDADGDEMARTFAAMWAQRRRRARWGLATRSVVGLIAVAAAEWIEALRASSRSGSRNVRKSGPPAHGRRGFRGGLATLIGSLLQDLRYACRSLVAQPAFTSTTLLALVVGVGLNTSLFTALNALLFRPWNVPEPESVVRLLSRHPRFDFGGLPIASAAWFESNARTIESAFAKRSGRVALDASSGGGIAQAALVSGGYFDVLGVDVVAGRAFGRGDDVPAAPAPVVVLARRFWKARYAADAGVIGSTIRLDGAPFTIIGVAEGSSVGAGDIDVWAPMSSMMLLRPMDSGNLARLTDPEFCCSDMYARLSPGSTYRQAEAELSALYRRFSKGAEQDGIDIAVAGTAMFDHPEMRRKLTPIVAISLAAVGSILLLACANVGNMLLARGAARQREIAVRIAMGAARRRVIRQLLTESLLLAVIAGVASVVVAPLLPPLVMRLGNQRLPTDLDLTPDGTVLAYALGITALAALAFGLAPAFRGTRVSVSESLRARSSRIGDRIPLQGVLIGVQVAVSVALLLAAGLLLRGLALARTLDLGFRTGGVTALTVQLPRNAYDAARERALFDDILVSLQAGGRSVGMASLLPLGDARNYTDFVVAGAAPEMSSAMAVDGVTAGYFDVLEIPILLGRTFGPGDRETGAILVNESLARLYWPERSPVGQIVTIGGRSREVVGMVGDFQLHEIGSSAPMYFAAFTANSQGVGEPPVIIVPSEMAAAVAAAVREAVADAAIESIPLSDQVDRSLGDTRGAARIAGLLACIALFLATVGVYGVVSYSVERRRRDIGIRMALGARPAEVLGFVLRSNAWPLALGLIVGLLISAGIFAALRSHIYGLSPLDPLALAAVAAILLLAGTTASVIPARRAVCVDPKVSLQAD